MFHLEADAPTKMSSHLHHSFQILYGSSTKLEETLIISKQRDISDIYQQLINICSRDTQLGETVGVL